jgi:type II secretory pathway pseudopilin PulG
MRRLAQRLRPRTTRDDAGITLVELLIVMLLSSVIMTATVAFFVSVARNTARSVDVTHSTEDASNVMNVISTGVRAAVRYQVEGQAELAPAVVAGSTSQSLTIITYTDAGPTFPDPLMVRFSIDSDRRMIEERWKPQVVNGFYVYPVSASGVPTTQPYFRRALGDVVMNTASENLFTYYTGPCASDRLNYVAASTAISNSDRGKVAFIRFTLKLRSIGSDETVQLDNRVGLPNMGITSEDVGTCT